MWHKKYESCLSCNLTTKPYMAKGLCRYCYLKAYQNDPANKARVDQQKHDWYVKQGGKDHSRVLREQRHFDGKRDGAIARDGGACKECGATEQLVVHHVDHNGRGSASPNNVDDNLVTLCRACHARHHNTIDRWSKKYDACLDCKTTERKHNARGLCWQCYLKRFPTTKKLYKTT